MVSKAGVATDKARLIAYCDPELKRKSEALAELRFRSLSNLIESVLAAEVAKAEQSGELASLDSEKQGKTQGK